MVKNIDCGVKYRQYYSIKNDEQTKKYSKDFNGSLKDVEVIKLIGVARNSYYKYKKELVKELQEENE